MTSIPRVRDFSNAVPLFAALSLPGDDILLRPECPADVPAREALLDSAFGPQRWQKTCERLRAGRAPAEGLALVAYDGDRLVGTLRLWHVHAGPGRPALLLGPLAVADSHRSRGLGRKLIGEALFRAVCRGHKAVLLVGDAPYYNRFGFERRFARDLVLPGPVEAERFLGLELEPGALAGACGLVCATGRKAVVAASRRAASLRKAA